MQRQTFINETEAQTTTLPNGEKRGYLVPLANYRAHQPPTKKHAIDIQP